MKILIYGAGVIGSLFAAKLFFSGQDVTVLARGKRFEEISKQWSGTLKKGLQELPKPTQDYFD